MLLHVHPRDDLLLYCEVSLGAHIGGELWTSGLLDGYGALFRPSCMQWDGDRLYGGTILPRERVAFNAYRPHCPMRWTGERCVVVFFSMVGWTNTTLEVDHQLEATTGNGRYSVICMFSISFGEKTGVRTFQRLN